MFSLRSLAHGFFSDSSSNSSTRNWWSSSGSLRSLPSVVTSNEKLIMPLLKYNHKTNSLVSSIDGSVNTASQSLCAAYTFGVCSQSLKSQFEESMIHCTAQLDTQQVITISDWQCYVGKPQFEKAIRQFFEDELAGRGFGVASLLSDFLFDSENGLKYQLFIKGCLPLITLGFAYEMHSRELVVEALVIAACLPADTRSRPLIDQRSAPRIAYFGSSNLSYIETLQRLRCEHQRCTISKEIWTASLENDPISYIEPLTTKDVKQSLAKSHIQLEEGQRASVVILVTYMRTSDLKTHLDNLIYLVAASHALRVLLCSLQENEWFELFQGWWQKVMAVYLTLRCPSLEVTFGKKKHTASMDWTALRAAIDAKGVTLGSPTILGIRALQSAALTWGDADSLYLHAACNLWWSSGDIEGGKHP